jgi:hypothetical protein
MGRIEAEVGKRKGGLLNWIDARFPLTSTLKYHATEYYASKNFNIWYENRLPNSRDFTNASAGFVHFCQGQLKGLR